MLYACWGSEDAPRRAAAAGAARGPAAWVSSMCIYIYIYIYIYIVIMRVHVYFACCLFDSEEYVLSEWNALRGALEAGGP